MRRFAGLVLLFIATTVNASTFQEGDNAFRQENYPLALKIFKKLAEQGQADAQAKLGHMYEQGIGVSQDLAQAVKWYKKAAFQGHKGGQSGLSYMAESWGNAEARKYLVQLAKKGDADSQYSLGKIYELGIEVEKNFALSREWYSKAAKQGHVKARYFLGKMYEDGIGVEKDITQAVKWYFAAAEKGNISAVANIFGFAREGNSYAQFQIGRIYESGLFGEKKDNQMAIKWYRLAAEQGNAPAQYNLGMMHADGRGVDKNIGAAIDLWKKAAAAGHKGAKAALKKVKAK